MNKSFIFLFLFPVFLIAQWKTTSDSNKFDGDYKSAFVVGEGDKLPYTKPSFGIKNFDSKEPMIFLINVGYTGCLNNILMFSFNDSDEVFRTSNVDVNLNNDAIFINEFNNLSVLNFIELLKTRSKLFIRYKSSCGSEDFEFGLSGSSKAIDFAAGTYFKDLALETQRLNKEKLIEEMRINQIQERMKASFNCDVPLKYIYKFKPSIDLMTVNMFDKNLIQRKIKFNLGDEITIYNRWLDKRLLISVNFNNSINKIFYVNPVGLWLLTEDPHIKWIIDNKTNLFWRCEQISFEEIHLIETNRIK
ncbi:hypothetical protein OO009_04725 [Flavobacteriaceae bacterium KMM 6897]|nr:hypothetical protein [Flavobacteriaceae bacterium KMM 6897]